MPTHAAVSDIASGPDGPVPPAFGGHFNFPSGGRTAGGRHIQEAGTSPLDRAVKRPADGGKPACRGIKSGSTQLTRILS
jgi:hypothetical protein